MSTRGSADMSAGPSSASSSTHPITSPSTTQTSPSSSRHTTLDHVRKADDDGFLGSVARWKDEGSSQVQTRHMIGVSPPPPRPPPAAPPPLPPSGHTRSASLKAKFHNAINNKPSQPFPAPSYPPPVPTHPVTPPGADFSALPSSVTGHRRNVSSSSSRKRLSSSPPPRSPHHISPRSSSLMAQQQAQGYPGVAVAGSQGNALGSPSQIRSPTRPKPARTPSRHLLQTALDLAQRAVEMDKNNDVAGALAAYREAVSRLRSVMERVGMEPGADKRRKSTAGRTEEEGRTLRGIHDAYVARIQLLSSFEDEQNGDEEYPEEVENDFPAPALSPSAQSKGHASASTATLVPPHARSPGSEATSGERTPRPSLDDTSTGIGNLMLNDIGDTSSVSSSHQSFRAPRSPTRTSSVEGLNTHRDMALRGLQQQSASGSSDGHGRPVIGSPIIPPPRRTSMAAIGSMSPQISMSPRMGHDGSPHASRRPRPSMGLESELDIAEDEVEVLSPGPLQSQMASPRRTPGSPENDKTLPPLPHSAPLLDRSIGLGNPSRPPSGSIGLGETSVRPHSGTYLVSPSVAAGTISQRRLSRGIDGVPESAALAEPTSIDGLPTSRAFPSHPSALPSPSQSLPPRIRARSQPGEIPREDDQVPPLPMSIRHRPSMSSQLHARAQSVSSTLGSRSAAAAAAGSSTATLAPPSAAPSTRGGLQRSPSGTLMSPIPEQQPGEIGHRSFHTLRLLCLSMDPAGSGAYLTSSIHVTPEVWKPSSHSKFLDGKPLPPPKIAAQDVKVRILESLVVNLEIIKSISAVLLEGPRESKFASDISGARSEGESARLVTVAEEFMTAIDALEEEMNASQKMLAKAGVQTNSKQGKPKKTGSTWGSKFSKTMDKITNSKALDSPETYVDLLSTFCFASQVLHEHLLCYTQRQCTVAYAALPNKSVLGIEVKLHNVAESYAATIMPFILDDFKQFFNRYLTSGMKYVGGI